MTPHRVYLAESDIQSNFLPACRRLLFPLLKEIGDVCTQAKQFQKPHNLYKIKLTTYTRSHASKNKHKKDN